MIIFGFSSTLPSVECCTNSKMTPTTLYFCDFPTKPLTKQTILRTFRWKHYDGLQCWRRMQKIPPLLQIWNVIKNLSCIFRKRVNFNVLYMFLRILDNSVFKLLAIIKNNALWPRGMMLRASRMGSVSVENDKTVSNPF